MAKTSDATTETSGGNGMTSDDAAGTGEMAQHKVGQVAGSVVGVMENARGVAGDIANRLPAASATTRQVVDQANQQMQTSSDEMLMLGSALAYGVALGLFLSGTNRVAVALALVPAVAMSATLVDRRSRSGGAA